MAQTHARKRIDIFAETVILSRVEEALTSASVSGYTVVPCIKGRGWHGEWHSDEIAETGRMVMVTAILRDETLDTVISSLQPLLKHWRIVISISDVSVIRSEKF